MFEIKPRCGIAVWVYSLKHVKQLRRYGLIEYVSKKMKYVYLYTDQDQVEATVQQLGKLKFVKKIDISHRFELDMDFDSHVGQISDSDEIEE